MIVDELAVSLVMLLISKRSPFSFDASVRLFYTISDDLIEPEFLVKCKS